MGLKYLWDSNIVIYFQQNNFEKDEAELIDKIVTNYQPVISVITEIELLCWKTKTKNDAALVNNFISDCIVYELDHEIKLKTVEIRKLSNIKLPDAIIAATALVKGLTLISNDRGFSKITSLKLLNPFKTI